jgi:hypothetical protein
MSIVGLVLLVAGAGIVTVMGIWLLVKAFQKSVLWGLGYLFVPFVNLVFVILHWEDTKKPFLYLLGGAVLMGLGAVLSGMGAPPMSAG